MATQINFGSVNRSEITNTSIKGLNIYAHLIHASTNTAFTTGGLAWDGVQVKVELQSKRFGNRTICEDNMRNLGAFCNFANPAFRGSINYLNNYRVLLAAASGVNEIAVATNYLDFGTVINLKGDDVLVVQINVTSGAKDSTVGSTSYVYFDAKEGDGYMYGVPRLYCETLQASKQNQSFSLGDNVTDIALLNYDKASVLTAAQVLQNITVSSDRLTIYQDYEECLVQQATQFSDLTVANYRLQSFLVHSGKEIDKCNVTLYLNSSNVAASNNILAYRQFYVTAETLAAATRSEKKHAAEFVRKLNA